jgi:hypothetical protein
MAALSAPRPTPTRTAQGPIAQDLYLKMAASQTIHQGGIVCVNLSGLAVPASAAVNLRVVGRAEESKVSAASGDYFIRVRRGIFKYGNKAGDLVAQADVLGLCYLEDDQTVRKTAAGTSVAGIPIEIESDGVWVELGVERGSTGVDVPFLAGADLSAAAAQYTAVKLDAAGKVVASGAGEKAIGILQNNPIADAIAIVRVLGVSNFRAGVQITIADLVASGAAAKAKVAVLGRTDTSDAGAAADPLLGSHVIGQALSAAAADGDLFRVLIHHMGAAPTTAA